jgi:tRNA 2-thiouridine synthesizing protein B
MSLLHTVNKSPFDRNTLESAVKHAREGSAVLLIEDGIYGAIKGTAKSAVINNALAEISFYVMGPDLRARGIDEDHIIEGITVVDYDEFVDLVTEHQATQSWL